MRRIFTLVLAAAGLIIAGCGYSTRSLISTQYRTIYVAPFENRIDITLETDRENKYKLYKPGLETRITSAVSNKYLFDGNLKPASSQTADLSLKSELVEFVRDPLSYDQNDDVKEYRVLIRVNLRLWNNKENKLE